MDNVGFYSALGFTPGHLTVTVTLEAARAGIQATTMSSLNPHERELALRQCRALVDQLAPGYDYTREIVLTAQHQLGDTLIVRKGERRGVVRGVSFGAAGRGARDGRNARAQDGREERGRFRSAGDAAVCSRPREVGAACGDQGAGSVRRCYPTVGRAWRQGSGGRTSGCRSTNTPGRRPVRWQHRAIGLGDLRA